MPSHTTKMFLLITKLLVSTVARNCDLIGCVGCFDCMVTYMYMYLPDIIDYIVYFVSEVHCALNVLHNITPW